MKSFDRRKFLEASVLLPLTAAFRTAATCRNNSGGGALQRFLYVRELARNLSAKSFEAADEKLPDGTDRNRCLQPRSIRFQPERAL
ncbi:hypothetical protein [Bradyrhizobium sp. ISRA442]|uniref:hypothetical protein n=1 Tax=Bradyrhizobium sp. ISRA442 TaxID=2866197 RepID=UPI00404B3A30